jgi:hypothetical protein
MANTKTNACSIRFALSNQAASTKSGYNGNERSHRRDGVLPIVCRRGAEYTTRVGDAQPAAALARPRLAHGFGQTINREFGMTVDRCGNPHAPNLSYRVAR